MKKIHKNGTPCKINNKTYAYLFSSDWRSVNCHNCRKHKKKEDLKRRREKRYLNKLKGSGFVG